MIRRSLLTIGFVLSLVTIGGQCRGSLAQSTIQSGPIPNIKPVIGPTADEWKTAYNDCVARLGMPVVLAGPSPIRSLGVGCAVPHEE
jgi:hypothetical protein